MSILHHLAKPRTIAELRALTGLPHPELTAELRRLGRQIKTIHPTTVDSRAIRYQRNDDAPAARDLARPPLRAEGSHVHRSPDPQALPVDLAGDVAGRDAAPAGDDGGRQDDRPAEARDGAGCEREGRLRRALGPEVAPKRTRSAARIAEIVALLSERGPLPRSQIARLLGMKIGQTGARVADALRSDLVIVAGHAVNRNGPPIELIGLPSQKMAPHPPKPPADLLAFVRRSIVIGGRASVLILMSAARYAGLDPTVKGINAAIEQIVSEGSIVRIRSNYFTNQQIWANAAAPVGLRTPLTRDDVVRALADGPLSTAALGATVRRSRQRMRVFLREMRRDRLVTYSDGLWRLIDQT